MSIETSESWNVPDSGDGAAHDMSGCDELILQPDNGTSADTYHAEHCNTTGGNWTKLPEELIPGQGPVPIARKGRYVRLVRDGGSTTSMTATVIRRSAPGSNVASAGANFGSSTFHTATLSSGEATWLLATSGAVGSTVSRVSIIPSAAITGDDTNYRNGYILEIDPAGNTVATLATFNTSLTHPGFVGTIDGVFPLYNPGTPHVFAAKGNLLVLTWAHVGFGMTIPDSSMSVLP